MSEKTRVVHDLKSMQLRILKSNGYVICLYGVRVYVCAVCTCVPTVREN